MTDWLQSLLLRTECSDPALFAADETKRWPSGALNWCVSEGLLVESQPASALACRTCAEQPIEQVVFLRQSQSDALAIYLPCPNCGPVLVTSERLRRWRVSFPRLLEMVFAERLPTWNCRETGRGRIWTLGRAT